MSVHNAFKPILESIQANPLGDLYVELARKTEAARSRARVNQQRMIESMVVEFRPDFLAAQEILGALKQGLYDRLEMDGGLPLEIEHRFADLKDAIEDAMTTDPEFDYEGDSPEE